MSEKLSSLRQKLEQFEHAGDYVGMLPIMREIVSLTGTILGENSVEYASALNDLGGILRDMGNYDQAENAFLRAGDILAVLIGTDHPDYATVLNNMAGLYRLTENYDRAEKLFKECLSIYDLTIGREHFLSISAMNNLGLVYQETERLDEANALHEQCLSMLEGKKDSKLALATTLNNLATLRKKQGKIDESIKMLDRVLGIYLSEVGEEHPLYACALNNLGIILLERGDSGRAGKYIDEAKRINLKLFGPEGVLFKSASNNAEKVKHHADKFSSSGMGLCERYYKKVCLPAMEKVLGERTRRMAVGLVGEGSECFNCDDEFSRDHDFGPRIMVWLTDEDYRSFGEDLSKVLSAIPRDFEGYSGCNMSEWGGGREGVFAIGDFYAKYTGLRRPPEKLEEWRGIPEENLATVVNGAVFADGLGEFTRHREALLSFYPPDVRLKKIAARCMRIAQSGQYNYLRCMKRGENVAAFVAGSEFVDSVISMVFLINRRYKPFYKWMHRLLKDLPILGLRIHSLLRDFTRLCSNDQKNASRVIEEVCGAIAGNLREEGLSDSRDDFLLEHGKSVVKKISNPYLRDSDPWVE
jgi:tetratricopeptide (TPR) repeat protein